MTRTVSIAEGRAHLCELLRRAKYEGETTIITRRGKPVARIRPLTPEEEKAARKQQG